MKTLLNFCLIASVISIAHAQRFDNGYWQQQVDYKMVIDMDVNTFGYTGTQELTYTNNSLDTLSRVFYHLYFNAFQPGSEMDVRSRSIADPDSRVADRISKLTPEEIGFLNVSSLKQDGKNLAYKVSGTILEVDLNKPIKPGESTTFSMVFNGQVPVQIRRSGRDNAEGISLSMAQWYPKLAEYDFEGWHADPYLGREFHGVWGDFDVTINIDKNYVIGGTGYLQNPEEIGHGYSSKKGNPLGGDKLSWHFKAPMVHDFTWGADPDYIHDSLKMKDGPTLHFFYQNDPKIIDNWKKLQPKTAELMTFFSKHIGKYPYDQYSVIQAGDGGMEYGMCTFITGNRSFESLFGVTAHEMAHSWFQFLLATNESQHEWMDEGFTSYISDRAEAELAGVNTDNPSYRSYRSYLRLAESGVEQPQSTHADRYNFNYAYGVSAYSKGAVFLDQLSYVIGQNNLDQTLKKYFNDWSFKHPTPNDFIRCAELVSGAELSWYLTDWTQTTNQIDYAVKSVTSNPSGTTVVLERLGLMPMPVDLTVTYYDGSSEKHHIPLTMMRAIKPLDPDVNVHDSWAWAYPTYSLDLKKEVSTVVIDPLQKMADVKRENNSYATEN
jgi:hypothetical protein